MYLRVVALLCLFSYSTANVASLVTKCADEDTKCLKDFIQKLIQELADGDSSLGIDRLEPVYVKTIDASSPNLKLILNDVTVKGLKDCIVKKSVMDGQYTMDGHLLILPINGNGKNHVSLDKAVFAIETDIVEDVLQDGKKHWIIPNWSYNYELKEKSKIKFENLFNGNAVLGKAAEEVIEENPNEIIQEIGTPILKAVIGKVVDIMGQFYKAIPIDDLVKY